MNSHPKTSTFQAAKDQFREGDSKGCLLALEKTLKESNIDQTNINIFNRDLYLLLNRLARLEKQRNSNIIADDIYQTNRNLLDQSIWDFIELMEKATNKPPTVRNLEDKYKVELVLNMNFEKTTDQDILKILSKIAAIIQTNPDEFIFYNKRPGSVIIELDLKWEEILKIKSLIQLGLSYKLEKINDSEEFWRYYMAWSVKNGTEAYLPQVSLPNSDLFNAKLSNADLSWSNLGGANLSGANLSGANLSRANLGGANLGEADLSEANLSKADLSRADLSKADLSKANLSGAFLRKVNLSRAFLHKCNLSEASLNEANLREANLNEANLSEANLSEANLSEANLSMADLSKINLSGAFLRKANLSGAFLRKANLSGAFLRRADLTMADLRGADLTMADLRGADLTMANMSDANLKQAVFNIEQADILKQMGIDISELKFTDDEEYDDHAERIAG